jgi:ribosomal-protein-alanine N-acetyltransferase
MADIEPTVDPSLTTARLHLRTLRADDATGFFEIHADAQAMRFWSTPAWTDFDYARRVIDRDRDELAAGTAYRFGLFGRADGRLIGCCSLHRVDRANRRGELGYILRPSHWGRGLAHEALAAIVGFAFDALDLNRLEADLDPRNAASVNVVARLGFVFEARMRERWLVGGEASDSDIYGLLRDDWLRHPPS